MTLCAEGGADGSSTTVSRFRLSPNHIIFFIDSWTADSIMPKLHDRQVISCLGSASHWVSTSVGRPPRAPMSEAPDSSVG